MFSRNIHYVVDGKEYRGVLSIGPIEEIGPEKCYCNFSIPHFHDSGGRICGLDPIDALQNCICFLGKLIRGLEQDGHILWWDERGDNCGILIHTLFPES